MLKKTVISHGNITANKSAGVTTEKLLLENLYVTKYLKVGHILPWRETALAALV